ncbi:kinesin-like protein KIN-7K, chloroplastic [Lactuca sativa]|uniref:Kinesin-like protein n=1 Tax=Lactuca sativa TaxID=4236 RepID=A0A9R1WT55_LACSA|nr:kinesin-like protein KIN-7K, chloroplastic [Lactuca sativa]KAJ0228281.1 hypothetical protein LSAT_V11C100023980 [Lactuca sativa]
MASTQGILKPRKSTSKYANSPSSSTTSSSKHFPEASVDNLSSPASSSRSKPQYFYSESLPLGSERSKENVTVTVRFRPLSPREIRRGEEIAWYADGETILRNEETPSIAYAYDRVFGPTTTTRHVYDIAAQHVVSGAMEGVNGTIFAYGVTSSGKTHTMHGDQRSPGIIPLAIKDAFSYIQETPDREFLLRVSYLEIYNEVVNDLLNPAGQNLRIREDNQGAFVEGIKEEVVLSPAHALSLIAAGEEHRHVGSTNFNLLSSRSHTIFTLTIESSPCGDNNTEGESVNFSQLNLIDLAGSESSKAETTGVSRKEGSYINKSLLTLGTVISKLTDGRGSHIPYRDSKLTRLLQSSLSGHGRVSLICTVTPSSSNSEETHNTLKFAHRAKHIEIQAAQNKIVDEKSLIKKYQNEIRSLKEELEQLKTGVVTFPQLKHPGPIADDILILKQKLKDGEVKHESKLDQEEEEEEAKAILLSRIQRLTKLILVSTKSSHPSKFSHLRRGYSFGEEELAYLPQRRRDLSLDEENMELYVSLDTSEEINNDVLKEDKKVKKTGLLKWLKLRKRDGSYGALTITSDRSSGAKSISSPVSTPKTSNHNHHPPIQQSRHSHSHSQSVDFLFDPKQDNQQQIIEDDNSSQHDTPVVSISSPSITRLNHEIKLKNEQISLLEAQVANNQLLQQQLNQKVLEIEQLQQKVTQLTESKTELESRNKKLADDSKYAKGLASAAAVELTALSDEVAKLMNQNERLMAELAAAATATTPKNSPGNRKTTGPAKNGRRENVNTRTKEQVEMKRELALSREREMSYGTLLSQKDEREAELRRRLEESKQREAYLENELANMWVMVAKLKRLQGAETEPSESSKDLD